MIETLATVAALTLVSPDRVFSIQAPHHGQQSRIVAEASLIPGDMKKFARCVSQRESHDNYRARNKSSSAQGRWQFLDIKWRVNGGIDHVVARRLTQYGMPKATVNEIREHLGETEIAKWAPAYQDIAFIQVVEEGGAHHWAHPGSACNQVMPS